MLDSSAKRLREEYAAAVAELDAATSMTGRMLYAGIPVEQLDTEFLAEERARKKMEDARRRMHAFPR